MSHPDNFRQMKAYWIVYITEECFRTIKRIDSCADHVSLMRRNLLRVGYTSKEPIESLRHKFLSSDQL